MKGAGVPQAARDRLFNFLRPQSLYRLPCLNSGFSLKPLPSRRAATSPLLNQRNRFIALAIEIVFNKICRLVLG